MKAVYRTLFVVLLIPVGAVIGDFVVQGIWNLANPRHLYSDIDGIYTGLLIGAPLGALIGLIASVFVVARWSKD